MCPNPTTLLMKEGRRSTFVCEYHAMEAFENHTVHFVPLRTPSYVACGSVTEIIPPPASYVPTSQEV